MAEIAPYPVTSLGGECPGLLVSVRSAAEARLAVSAGADVIDVKEPARGSLGCPAPEVARAVVASVGGRRPVSMALGELLDLEAARHMAAVAVPPVLLAKIGLAGAGGLPHWWRTWERAWTGLPSELGRVGVIYADWREARAPLPAEAIEVFASAGCRAILFDTCIKDGRSLLDVAEPCELGDWMVRARTAAPTLVLAGSLTTDSLSSLREFRPDYVAVRGAVCRGGRLGRVSGQRIRGFLADLRRHFGPCDAAPAAQAAPTSVPTRAAMEGTGP